MKDIATILYFVSGTVERLFWDVNYSEAFSQVKVPTVLAATGLSVLDILTGVTTNLKELCTTQTDLPLRTLLNDGYKPNTKLQRLASLGHHRGLAGLPLMTSLPCLDSWVLRFSVPPLHPTLMSLLENLKLLSNAREFRGLLVYLPKLSHFRWRSAWVARVAEDVRATLEEGVEDVRFREPPSDGLVATDRWFFDSVADGSIWSASGTKWLDFAMNPSVDT